MCYSGESNNQKNVSFSILTSKSLMISNLIAAILFRIKDINANFNFMTFGLNVIGKWRI